MDTKECVEKSNRVSDLVSDAMPLIGPVASKEADQNGGTFTGMPYHLPSLRHDIRVISSMKSMSHIPNQEEEEKLDHHRSGAKIEEDVENPNLVADSSSCRKRSQYFQNLVKKWHTKDIVEEQVYDRQDKLDRACREFDTKTTVPGSSQDHHSNSNSVEFDSIFECGNLKSAKRIYNRKYPQAADHWQPQEVDQEYDLYLQEDTNTKGYIQWFYFALTSTKTTKPIKVRLNLKNMMKKDSLYNEGMRPVMFMHSLDDSMNHEKKKKSCDVNIGELAQEQEQDTQESSAPAWRRTGSEIAYYQNTSPLPPSKTTESQRLKYYSTLTMVVDVQPRSRMYLAHCFPYSVSFLHRFLSELEHDPERSCVLRRKKLALTVARNRCDMITITEPSSDPCVIRERSVILLSARVHPGETNSSFIMHGILEFLTRPDEPAAKLLRQKYVLKLVPMLNPDGVIHGNYRCSLSGKDLNRRYMDPCPRWNPTIFGLKQYLLSQCKPSNSTTTTTASHRPSNKSLRLYCDIHGHSRKKNVFLYGCPPHTHESASMMPIQFPTSKPKPMAIMPTTTQDHHHDHQSSSIEELDRFRSKVFPYLLWKSSRADLEHEHGMFSYQDSTFTVQRSKQGTGRVVVWKEMKLDHSYTLESSFCGVGKNHRSSVSAEQPRPHRPETHFTISDYLAIGHHVCQTLVRFHDENLVRPTTTMDTGSIELDSRSFKEEEKAQVLGLNPILLQEIATLEERESREKAQENDNSSDSDPSGDNLSYDELRQSQMWKSLVGANRLSKRRRRKSKTRRKKSRPALLLKTRPRPHPQPPLFSIASRYLLQKVNVKSSRPAAKFYTTRNGNSSSTSHPRKAIALLSKSFDDMTTTALDPKREKFTGLRKGGSYTSLHHSLPSNLRTTTTTNARENHHKQHCSRTNKSSPPFLPHTLRIRNSASRQVTLVPIQSISPTLEFDHMMDRRATTTTSDEI